MTWFGVSKEDEHATEPTIGSFSKWDRTLCQPEEQAKILTSSEESSGRKESCLVQHPASREARDEDTTAVLVNTNAIIEEGGQLPRNQSETSMESTDDDTRFQRLLDEVGNEEEAQHHSIEDAHTKMAAERASWQGRNDVYVKICGMTLRRRTYGILAAVFNGCYGGSVLAPLKFAHGAASGISFVISFGVGVLGITSFIWIAWWILYKLGITPHELPSLQLRILLLPGTISGILWSLGNFCSIYAVIFLGQATGYSACQANIAISGVWGIFYYREQMSRHRILLWFVSAGVAISGIFLLTIAK
jgi:hypothetical protein